MVRKGFVDEIVSKHYSVSGFCQLYSRQKCCTGKGTSGEAGLVRWGTTGTLRELHGAMGDVIQA